jgi:hypothetical protein
LIEIIRRIQKCSIKWGVRVEILTLHFLLHFWILLIISIDLLRSPQVIRACHEGAASLARFNDRRLFEGGRKEVLTCPSK